MVVDGKIWLPLRATLHATLRATLLSMLLAASVAISIPAEKAKYLAGVGIADTTGPAADIVMMGYAKQSQTTCGIHTRLYSRAFIFVENNNNDDDVTGRPSSDADDVTGKQRAVFVSVDVGMIGQLVKKKVIANLQQEFGPLLYTEGNVVLSATHTHSGPAGFLQYLTFGVSSLGFIEETFQGLVQGITESIRRAHNNIQPARLYFNEGSLHNANINRSPTSYLANPAWEREKYKFNTDHTFTQLTISSHETGQALGLINWFAVHPVSMNSTNRLISADNKGLASVLFEKDINGEQARIGQGPFVAAFASSNLGDTSPHLNGARCRDSGLPCDLETSSCNGRSSECVGSGPGRGQFESTEIIARRQYSKAMELFKNTDTQVELSGSIRSAHKWVNMARQKVKLPNGKVGKTCPAALGYSFAAGTTDGPGEFDFVQGTNESSPFWEAITNVLKEPSPQQVSCHAPKPILLNTGQMTYPYNWHPEHLDTQVLKIGHLVIAAVPAEFTTMAGRRLRDSVRQSALSSDTPDKSSTPWYSSIFSQTSPAPKVVLAGLSNSYSHYVTTFEEYQKQRYEGASTIFGPHTLRAYQKQFSYLTKMVFEEKTIQNPGQPPPDLKHKQMHLVPSVLLDTPGLDHDFGDCVVEPEQMVRQGTVVSTRFISGHPRNNLMLEKTFLTVEKRLQLNSSAFLWDVIATDSDWETKFIWHRSLIPTESQAEIIWTVPQDQEAGFYRIRHFGFYKPLGSSDPAPYEGESKTFEVTSMRPYTYSMNRRQQLLHQQQHQQHLPNVKETHQHAPVKLQHQSPNHQPDWGETLTGFLTKLSSELSQLFS